MCRSTVELPSAVLDSFAGIVRERRRPATRSRAAPGGLVVTSRASELPARRDRPEQTFEVTAGEHAGERFDFPLEGFGRFGSRLAERVA